MSEASHRARSEGPSYRSAEIGVALFTGLLGAITIAGSIRVGINWGVEGPRSGFFPFYIGVMIIVSSVVNLIRATAIDPGPRFASWHQLQQVLSVVIPTAIYVVVIPYSGIYLASALLIAVFMLWLGRYKWPITAAVAIGVPIICFLMFEKWFLVPLPKGPLEDFLGL